MIKKFLFRYFLRRLQADLKRFLDSFVRVPTKHDDFFKLYRDASVLYDDFKEFDIEGLEIIEADEDTEQS